MANFDNARITDQEKQALLIQNLADRPNAMNSYGRAKMSAEDVKKAFDDQFILVVNKHNLLHESVEEIRGEAQTERLESLENRTETLEGRADTIETRADALEDRADTLDTRADTLEDRADTVDERLGDQNAADSIEDVIQRVADLESLLDDPDKQDTLNESYQGVRERVKQNENDISKNADAISENNANIVGHEGRLESLEIAMGNHYNMILTNNQNISTLSPAVQTNSQAIQELDTDVKGLDTSVKNMNSHMRGYDETLQDIGDFLTYNQGDTDNVFLRCYPVGSIYMSVKSTSPATLFGGTWTQLNDRFLVGTGSTYSNGATGGATTHSHGAGTLGAAATMTGSSILIKSEQRSGSNYTPGAKINASSRDTYSQQTDYIVPVYGNTASVNHMPPYLAVYMWKRTA